LSAWHQCRYYTVSTQQQAIAFLDSLKRLDSSKYWPNVDPELFLENLKTFATTPLKFYEGKGTNFCAYSALTYIPLNYDPLGFQDSWFAVSKRKSQDGKSSYKTQRRDKKRSRFIEIQSALDISPAGQIWFLCLADHFKGYLNFFNRRFHKADENTLWASTNFAKFNRMLRRLFPVKVHARGADLIRPWIAEYS
jgi:hypothetical protein